ncbi:hypothetical protein MPS_1215 [Mycobacterium pseudoshottsii JCM 15466]|nr:hypothetical protein MPS_1215 [Mycobacterium pseudoshottsii JCM 15466]
MFLRGESVITAIRVVRQGLRCADVLLGLVKTRRWLHAAR